MASVDRSPRGLSCVSTSPPRLLPSRELFDKEETSEHLSDPIRPWPHREESGRRNQNGKAPRGVSSIATSPPQLLPSRNLFAKVLGPEPEEEVRPPRQISNGPRGIVPGRVLRGLSNISLNPVPDREKAEKANPSFAFFRKERGLPDVMLLQTQLASKQKQEEKAGIESNISSAGKVGRGRAKRVYRNESTAGAGSPLKENSGCMKRKSEGKHVVRDYKQSAKTFSTGNSVLLGPSSQLACKQKQEEKAGIESNVSSAGKVGRGRAKRVFRNERTAGTGSLLKENSGCMKRKSKGKHVVRDYKQSAKTFSTGNGVLLGPSGSMYYKGNGAAALVAMEVEVERDALTEKECDMLREVLNIKDSLVKSGKKRQIVYARLTQLQGMALSADILQATKIARVVGSFRKHGCGRIRSLASHLIWVWESILDEWILKANAARVIGDDDSITCNNGEPKVSIAQSPPLDTRKSILFHQVPSKPLSGVGSRGPEDRNSSSLPKIQPCGMEEDSVTERLNIAKRKLEEVLQEPGQGERQHGDSSIGDLLRMRCRRAPC